MENQRVKGKGVCESQTEGVISAVKRNQHDTHNLDYGSQDTPLPEKIICKKCNHRIACKRTKKACYHFQEIDMRLK